MAPPTAPPAPHISYHEHFKQTEGDTLIKCTHPAPSPDAKGDVVLFRISRFRLVAGGFAHFREVFDAAAKQAEKETYDGLAVVAVPELPQVWAVLLAQFYPGAGAAASLGELQRLAREERGATLLLGVWEASVNYKLEVLVQYAEMCLTFWLTVTNQDSAAAFKIYAAAKANASVRLARISFEHAIKGDFLKLDEKALLSLTPENLLIVVKAHFARDRAAAQRALEAAEKVKAGGGDIESVIKEIKAVVSA